MAPIRRNAEQGTIEVSTKAFNFGVSIFTAFVLATAGIGYNLVVDHAVMVERVKHLEDFANEGDRNTAADGRARDREIQSLKEWKQRHTEWGRQLAGKWNAQLDEHERRLDRFEQNGVMR